LPECRAKALFTSCKAGCNVRPALDSGWGQKTNFRV
jgi:hypothetical protein